jgi:hypothetical protein
MKPFISDSYYKFTFVETPPTVLTSPSPLFNYNYFLQIYLRFFLQSPHNVGKSVLIILNQYSELTNGWKQFTHFPFFMDFFLF